MMGLDMRVERVFSRATCLPLLEGNPRADPLSHETHLNSPIGPVRMRRDSGYELDEMDWLRARLPG